MAPADAKQPAKSGAPSSGLEFFHDVSMKITVEFARTEMSIRDLLRLKAGGILELNKMAGEPLDIRLNGRLIARGEAVIVNDRFGVRVTEIVSPEDVVDSLGEAEN
jgi:flagellar motor switch protein FliN/FliY